MSEKSTFDLEQEYRARIAPLLTQIAKAAEEMGISYITAFAIASDGKYIKTDARIVCNGVDKTPPEIYYTADIMQLGVREAHKRMSMRMVAQMLAQLEPENDEARVLAQSEDAAIYPGDKLN